MLGGSREQGRRTPCSLLPAPCSPPHPATAATHPAAPPNPTASASTAASTPKTDATNATPPATPQPAPATDSNSPPSTAAHDPSVKDAGCWMLDARWRNSASYPASGSREQGRQQGAGSREQGRRTPCSLLPAPQCL